ncbi:unnamed protein product [Prorocentrum cordatum]|uniref:Uncharacterized protein n=1 Tax=Prorocentrum cordatum TaxID=2364126 RepID=A0ABN9QRP5_9DINO|nr:unnamed protein product [Polarella glacialis]
MAPPRVLLWGGAPLRLAALLAAGRWPRAATREEAASRGLPGGRGSAIGFLECEGPEFDPAWAEFRRQIPPGLGRDAAVVTEALAAQAANLVGAVEAQDIGAGAAAFGARLRSGAGGGEPTESTGFCLYGAVAAYAVWAEHLRQRGAAAAAEQGAPGPKSFAARALLLLAKKQANDFLESTGWPVRSLELVALLQGEDAAAIRGLEARFRLPCHLTLGCAFARLRAEEAVAPPPPPLPSDWPRRVAAAGLHITSTLEAVTALQGAVSEAWGRGGAGGAPFEVHYAGHPCPSHAGSEHQCAMRCELLGLCDPGSEAADPLAEFLAGAVDTSNGRFKEREGYSLAEARAALRWAPRRLDPIRQADMVLCTFPTVLCVLLHELFPQTPQLFVAIANPLFAAPGCAGQEDSTVIACDSDEGREYLTALRGMLAEPGGPVRGLAGYAVTAALVSYQVGVALPLGGKAGRYLPAGAVWRQELSGGVAPTEFAGTLEVHAVHQYLYLGWPPLLALAASPCSSAAVSDQCEHEGDRALTAAAGLDSPPGPRIRGGERCGEPSGERSGERSGGKRTHSQHGTIRSTVIGREMHASREAAPVCSAGALADLSESLPAALGRPHGLLRLLQLHLLADLSAVLLLSALGLSFRYQTLGMADKARSRELPQKGLGSGIPAKWEHLGARVTSGNLREDRAAQVIATVLPAGLALARLPLLLCMERSCRQTVRLFEERSQPAARVLRRLLRALQHRKLQWSSAAFAAVCSLAVTWSLTIRLVRNFDPSPWCTTNNNFMMLTRAFWYELALRTTAALAVVYAALGLAVAAAAKVARRSRQSAEPRGGLPLELLACLPTHVAGGAHAPARGADLCCAMRPGDSTVQDGETLRRLPCARRIPRGLRGRLALHLGGVPDAVRGGLGLGGGFGRGPGAGRGARRPGEPPGA